MNSDSNKNLFIAFALIVPAIIAILCVAVLSGQSDPIEAIKTARRPRNLLDEVSDMRMRVSEKKWEEALQAARVVLQREPEHEEALRTVASLALTLKRPGEAAVALKALVEAVPEDIPTVVRYARTLELVGELDLAQEQWAAVAKSPYASASERSLARKALGGVSPEVVLPSPPPMAIAPEEESRLQ